MKRLIFLGPPGAGKGTQAKALSSTYQIPHISTGEILRRATTAQTLLGQKAKVYMDKGELVPDELILDLIKERLAQPDSKKGWVLDGFPRNLAQASFLEQLLANLDQSPDFALNLIVPDEVVITRMLERDREDDNEDTIRRRLQVYRDDTAPVISFYQERGILKSIDGNQSMEAVTSSLQTLVES